MQPRSFLSISRLLLIVLIIALLPAPYTRTAKVYATVHPKIVSSFSAPGGQVKALSWGNNSLWLADKNGKIYHLDENGALLGSFSTTIDVSDLGWFENSLWANDSSHVYQLDSVGQIVNTLNVGYWAKSGMEWAEGYLYVNDYNFGPVYKHDRSGNTLLSWDTTFFWHPEDMAYDSVGLWIADSCEGSNSLWRYSLLGVFQDSLDLNSVETCDSTSERALAWDGKYLWYAGKFTVYRLDITGNFVDTNATLTGVSASDSAWGDYDNDADLDIIVIGNASSAPSTKIYRNDGNNVFTDIQAAIANVDNGSVDWGDYDRDGDLDILLTGCADSPCSARLTRVYQNNGNGVFANVLSAGLPGVAHSDARWGDYNNDGYPDILLLGHTGSEGISRIYRNNGNATFSSIQLGQLSNGAVAWADYDNDGDLDALISGCYTATCSATSLYLYRNDGADTFTSGFTSQGARDSAVAWGDYDNDGYMDFLLTGSVGWAAAEICKTTIYHNNQGTSFTDIGALISGACQGSASWGDYNQDGVLDIVIAGNSTPGGSNSRMTKIYRNNGNGEFTDIQASLKDIYQGTVSWGDYDGDNDLDILLTGETSSLIYRNLIMSTNAAPTAPAGLKTISCTASSCVLQWNASSDDHSPAAGLTYNVRVGSMPGAADIMPAMAILGSGKRLVPELGNAGQVLTFQLRGLQAATTYYWSVQAIDAAYVGSPFAGEASFTTQSSSATATATATTTPTSTPTSGYSISGTVRTSTQAALGGVTIRDAAGHSTTTDASGSYTLSGLAAGQYTLTPTKSGMSFSPATRSISVPPGATGQDFQAQAAENGGSWTFMLYLAGDNDLATDMRRAIRELEALAPNPNLTIVVLFDGERPNDTRRFVVQPAANYTNGVNSWSLGELNMGDPQTLIDFISWTRANHPADHSYLAIADHGRGTSGVAWDDNNKSDYLNTMELREALRLVTVNGQQPIDILHYDTCLMAMLENVYQVQEYVDYVIASENLGWSLFGFADYSQAVSSTSTPRVLASTIAERYYRANRLQGYPRTISVLESSKVRDVRQAVDNLAQALIAKLGSHKTYIQILRDSTQKFDSREYYKITKNDEYIDLYDFAVRTKDTLPDASVQQSTQQVMDAVKAMVIAEYHESGPWNGNQGYWDLDHAHGVSIYFPPQSGSQDYRNYTDHQIFQFTAESQWDNLLTTYFTVSGLPQEDPNSPERPPMPSAATRIYLPYIHK